MKNSSTRKLDKPVPQEGRKISNKQSNFILKGSRKTTINKAQSEK